MSDAVYDHARYEPMRRFLRFAIRVVAGITVRFDKVEGVENVPLSGPVILYSNHIALVDPVLIIHVLPRNIVPLAKVEVFKYPLIGIFPRLWNVIPVRRGEIDRQALHGCLDILAAGEAIWVAPEGTRRPAFEEAKDGLSYLATRSNATLVPLGIDGTPGFPTLPFSRRRMKGPGVKIRFGHPFRFKTKGRAGRDELARMTREAMYQVAKLLPPERRGIFSDLSQASEDTIEWI
jgi:1-acyl-sn-glycerol-3-phosphate acyltransferase